MSGEPVQSAWNVMLFLADERNDTTAIALTVKATTTKKTSTATTTTTRTERRC